MLCFSRQELLSLVVLITAVETQIVSAIFVNNHHFQPGYRHDWMRKCAVNLVSCGFLALQLRTGGIHINTVMLLWFYWLKQGVNHGNRPRAAKVIELKRLFKVTTAQGTKGPMYTSVWEFFLNIQKPNILRHLNKVKSFLLFKQFNSQMLPKWV